MPREVEAYTDRIFPPQYWSRLARRYPLMIGQLHNNMRVGVENDEAIVNCVLPGEAAHNLVLGGELLIASAPGAGPAVATTQAAGGGTPKTIEDALQLKTSYSFDNNSLEFAIRDLADDVSTNLLKGSIPFAIKIMGNDLQKDGITRNQPIRDFKQEGKTVSEILTALVRKANPDPSAKDASDAAQKLLWVIAPDPERPTNKIILVTTRAAAETNKYTLPEMFKLKK
jgi:hypothetical protein